MTIQELKTRYPSLDAGNNSFFIADVRRAVEGDEIPNTDIRNWLDSLIDGFGPEGQRICALRNPLAADKDALTVASKVLAAQMLLLKKMNSLGALRQRTLLFLQYSAALSGSNYAYVEAMLDTACYNIGALGFQWKDVQAALSPDQLVYKFITEGRFVKENSESVLIRQRGSVQLKDGRLTISSFAGMESGSEAFRTGGGRVAVFSRSARDERLKASESGDAAAVSRFAKSFLEALDSAQVSREARQAPAEGDKVNIICIGETAESRRIFRVLDEDFPFEGVLEDEELVVGFNTEDLERYIFQDDCIEGAVLVCDGGDYRFSVRACYQEFAVAEARAAYLAGSCFEARVTRVRNDINRLNWISALSFAGLSDIPAGPAPKEGDVRIMEMRMLPNIGRQVFINICVPRGDVNEIIRLEEEGELLRFVCTKADILARQERALNRAAASDNATMVLERIASVLASRAYSQPPMERYRMLLASMFLYRILGKEECFLALQTEIAGLENRLVFAQGGNVPSTGPFGDLPEDVCGQIDSLVQAYDVSRRFPDEFRTDADTVRRKICSLLGVESEFRPAGVRRVGKYGSVERQDLEFKSSYVMRNDGNGADLDYQGRGQVFEAVCGFLNADGGVLYLGVSDAGDPLFGEGYGLQGDMDWLCANYDSINRKRRDELGHSVKKPDTLDHFVLFLNSERELYFKETLHNLIEIAPTKDADAIQIKVGKSEYELAYLYSDKSRTDGIAYVRDGGSTRRMTEHQKRQRLLSLRSVEKEAGFVVTIQEAIDQHRKLIFKGYTSGNSGKVEDRFVVPVNLFYNNENVYCLDLVSKNYKQFRLHRISSIEPYGDEPYPLPADAVRKDADVFRWLGDKSYHVRVRMKAAAYNYLIEEYSLAKDLPKEQLYEESNGVWVLDTYLQGIGAIRRFYLGLADKMEILDTEDAPVIRREITKFVNEYLIK